MTFFFDHRPTFFFCLSFFAFEHAQVLLCRFSTEHVISDGFVISHYAPRFGNTNNLRLKRVVKFPLFSFSEPRAPRHAVFKKNILFLFFTRKVLLFSTASLRVLRGDRQIRRSVTDWICRGQSVSLYSVSLSLPLRPYTNIDVHVITL